jgi:hypothetical protein
MTTTNPLGCSYCPLTYFPGQGLVLVSSGSIMANLEYKVATYLWSGTNWVLITDATATNPPSQTLRAEFASAYDTTSSSNKFILFGGKGLPGLEYSNQVDGFSGTAWTNILPNYQPETTSPAIRSKSMMASVSTGALLFGGQSEFPWMYQDLWLYSNGAWTNLIPTTLTPSITSPSIRLEAAFASNASGGAGTQVVMFGGRNNWQMLNDTWVYTVGTGWSQVSPVGGVQPSTRAGAAFCYYGTGGYYLLQGGNDSSGNVLGDTWSFNAGTSTWTQLTPTYTPLNGNYPFEYRTGAAMAFDSNLSQCILTCGKNSKNTLNDTWLFNGNWIQQ